MYVVCFSFRFLYFFWRVFFLAGVVVEGAGSFVGKERKEKEGEDREREREREREDLRLLRDCWRVAAERFVGICGGGEG